MAMPPEARVDDALRRAGTVAGVAGLALIVGAGAWLVASGRGEVRYSADHPDTVALWRLWLPALVGLALTLLVPPRLPRIDLLRHAEAAQVRREAAVCTLAAVAYALVLPLGGRPSPDLWYVGVRLALLVALPLLVLRSDRRWVPAPPPEERPGHWYWTGPAVPVAAWLALAWFGPFGTPGTAAAAGAPAGPTLLVLVAGGFVINSLLEEIVYRFWLQTRLERMLGVWPGVVVASLLWAVWHVAIQGTGDLTVDIAVALARHGVLGLFLGALWARYRNPWAPILLHGAVNASPAVFLQL